MRLEVSCEDRLGLTRELLDRLVEHNIDLRGIEIDTSGIIYLNFPELEFRDFQHLMPEIRRIPGVYDVKTIPYMPSEREHHEIEALLKALPDLVFSLDAKGKVTQANQSALTTLALPVEEVRGAALRISSMLACSGRRDSGPATCAAFSLSLLSLSKTCVASSSSSQSMSSERPFCCAGALPVAGGRGGRDAKACRARPDAGMRGARLTFI